MIEDERAVNEEPLVSWAQNREDVVLWRALADVSPGRYVDVGAADPVEDSVTKLFYDQGWSGLNVEPVGVFADRLRTQRERDVTLQACAGAEPSSMTLHVVEDSGLSTLNADAADRARRAGYTVVDETVDVMTLDQMLDDVGFTGSDIHFLKIDVEGFEREVLDGLDLAVWRPWVIVVESTAPNSIEPVHGSWEPELLASGYEFAIFDGLNRFYVARERDHLLAALSYPACWRDAAIVSAPHHRVLVAYDELLDAAKRSEAALVETQASYRRLEDVLGDAHHEIARLTALHDAAVDNNQMQANEIEALVAVNETLTKETEALVTVNATLTMEIEALVAANETLSVDATELQADLEQQASEVATLRAAVVRMADEVDGLRDELGRRNAALSSAERSLDEITRSSAWRLTGPLRRAADLVKRVR